MPVNPFQPYFHALHLIFGFNYQIKIDTNNAKKYEEHLSGSREHDQNFTSLTYPKESYQQLLKGKKEKKKKEQID